MHIHIYICKDDCLSQHGLEKEHCGRGELVRVFACQNGRVEVFHARCHAPFTHLLETHVLRQNKVQQTSRLASKTPRQHLHGRITQAALF